MQLGLICMQSHSGTLGPKMFGVGDFWLETRVIIKISTILATQETLTDFHWDEAKKNNQRFLSSKNGSQF